MCDEDRGTTHVDAGRAIARGGDARSVGDYCRSASDMRHTWDETVGGDGPWAWRRWAA
jgi:hypothetical protein